VHSEEQLPKTESPRIDTSSINPPDTVATLRESPVESITFLMESDVSDNLY
jgi:hypothetical protein